MQLSLGAVRINLVYMKWDPIGTAARHFRVSTPNPKHTTASLAVAKYAVANYVQHAKSRAQTSCMVEKESYRCAHVVRCP